MSKKIKYLIMGLAAVLLLVAVMVFLMWLPKQEEPEDSSSTSSTVTIPMLNKERNTVQKVVVQNENGGYTALHGKEDETWYIENLEGLPASADHFNFMAQQCSTLSASQIAAESSSNLADFGLADPVATVDVTYSDGSTEQILVGNKSLNSGTYVKLKSDDKIYLTSNTALNAFFYSEISFVKRQLYVEPSANESAASEEELIDPSIQKIKLSGTRHAEPLVLDAVEKDDTIATDPSEVDYLLDDFVITSPKKRNINADLFNAFTADLFDTEITRTVMIHPTEEDLEEYGLKDPYVVLELDYTPDSDPLHVKWSISEPKNGTAYLMLDDYAAIYEITVSETNSWIEQDYGTLSSRILILPYIYNVSHVIVETDEKAYDFVLTYTKDPEDETKEIMSVSCGGKELDTENFRMFYQLLVGATTSEYTTEQPEGDPVLSFRYRYRKSSKRDDVVEFIPGPARKVFMGLNKEFEFYTSQVYVDKVYTDLQKVLNNEEIVVDW